MSAIGPLAAWRGNPFFVLELKTDATRIEIERAGQRLLALLGVKAAGSADYATPLGNGTRDEETVRQALAVLRDPVQRLNYELWADIAPISKTKNQSNNLQDPMSTWEGAERAIGWAKGGTE